VFIRALYHLIVSVNCNSQHPFESYSMQYNYMKNNVFHVHLKLAYCAQYIKTAKTESLV